MGGNLAEQVLRKQPVWLFCIRTINKAEWRLLDAPTPDLQLRSGPALFPILFLRHLWLLKKKKQASGRSTGHYLCHVLEAPVPDENNETCSMHQFITKKIRSGTSEMVQWVKVFSM